MDELCGFPWDLYGSYLQSTLKLVPWFVVTRLAAKSLNWRPFPLSPFSPYMKIEGRAARPKFDPMKDSFFPFCFPFSHPSLPVCATQKAFVHVPIPSAQSCATLKTFAQSSTAFNVRTTKCCKTVQAFAQNVLGVVFDVSSHLYNFCCGSDCM